MKLSEKKEQLEKEIYKLQNELDKIKKEEKDMDFLQNAKNNIDILKKTLKFLELYEEINKFYMSTDCDYICGDPDSKKENVIKHRICPFIHICEFIEEREILDLDPLRKLIKEVEDV